MRPGQRSPLLAQTELSDRLSELGSNRVGEQV